MNRKTKEVVEVDVYEIVKEKAAELKRAEEAAKIKRDVCNFFCQFVGTREYT